MNNFSFIYHGIKNLIERNYRLRLSLFDLNALIDSSLGMPENWYNIKSVVLFYWKK